MNFELITVLSRQFGGTSISESMTLARWSRSAAHIIYAVPNKDIRYAYLIDADSANYAREAYTLDLATLISRPEAWALDWIGTTLLRISRPMIEWKQGVTYHLQHHPDK